MRERLSGECLCDAGGFAATPSDVAYLPVRVKVFDASSQFNFTSGIFDDDQPGNGSMAHEARWMNSPEVIAYFTQQMQEPQNG